MPGLMADNDSRGQFAVMLALLEKGTWNDIWKDLGFTVEDFKGLGLPENAPDSAVWQACRQRDIILITSNRNAEGQDSLETTIRTLGTANSLPVITIANPRRVMESKAYAERAVVRLLDYLQELDNYRGVGRLFVP